MQIQGYHVQLADENRKIPRKVQTFSIRRKLNSSGVERAYTTDDLVRKRICVLNYLRNVVFPNVNIKNITKMVRKKVNTKR